MQVSALAPIALDKPVAPLIPLAGSGRAELAAQLGELGVPAREQRMRVAQLWHWIYHRGATDFGVDDTIGKEMRAGPGAKLQPRTPTDRLGARLLRRHAQMAVADGAEGAEATRAPKSRPFTFRRSDRGTLCVSSQVGCTLACSFCHTGTQRLVRNLEAAEIVGQLLVARDQLGDLAGRRQGRGRRALPDAPRLISNIVFMGMGEPLYNFEAVKDAVETIADGEGLSLSRRRITISTSGVVPDDPAHGRRDRHDARDLAPCGARRAARRAGAAQQEIPDPSCSMRAAPIRACRTPAHHLRIRDAEERKRQQRRRARAGAPAARHSGQDQSDPVQPLAGQHATNARTGTASRPFPRSCSTPATPRPFARRAGATFSPLAAS